MGYRELESLKHNELYLKIPISLDISGSKGNWLAMWEDTATMDVRVEGEGRTVDEALEDCREDFIRRYLELREKIASGARMSADEERTWLGLCHYIRDVKSPELMPGEEFSYFEGEGVIDHKGPFMG